MVEMNHCMQCGHKLILRPLENEGMIPYCPACQDYRFPVFSTAISAIVLNKEKNKILLIKQYGRDSYILVAGYVNKGEDVEDTVAREIKEETGLSILEAHFNHSHYFKPSNTLMLNWTAVVDSEELHPNKEIDSYAWFSFEEARKNIRKGSLAEEFLLGYLDGAYCFKH